MTQLGQSEKWGRSQSLICLYRCRCCVNSFMLRQGANASPLLGHFTGGVQVKVMKWSQWKDFITGSRLKTPTVRLENILNTLCFDREVTANGLGFIFIRFDIDTICLCPWGWQKAFFWHPSLGWLMEQIHFHFIKCQSIRTKIITAFFLCTPHESDCMLFSSSKCCSQSAVLSPPLL